MVSAVDHVELQVFFTLPDFALPSYWTRYQLPVDRVRKLLESCESCTVWKLALSLGATISPECVRPSTYRQYDVLISGKSLAVGTVLERSTCTDHAPSELEFTKVESQATSLPTYSVPEEIYSQLLNRTFRSSNRPTLERSLGIQTTSQPCVFAHLNQLWVVERAEVLGVVCVRLGKLHQACAGTLAKTLGCRRVTVLHENCTYFITHERVLFKTS